MSVRERLLFGKSYEAIRAMPHLAGPKPWPDKDKTPWDDGDPDGGAVGNPSPYHDDPGESVDMPPREDPGGDHLNLRSSFETAAAASRDPEAARALLAIEARLAEITQFMKSARLCGDRPTVFKLDVLSQIL
jgi:hypothetical protein